MWIWWLGGSKNFKKKVAAVVVLDVTLFSRLSSLLASQCLFGLILCFSVSAYAVCVSPRFPLVSAFWSPLSIALEKPKE